MNLRTLPILNAIGCVLLTGLVIGQWRHERGLEGELGRVRAELAAAHDRHAEESKRRAALERDLGVLKEALEATQKAAEAGAERLTVAEASQVRLQADLDAARQQLGVWEAAVATRDARIRDVQGQLAATRKRLDEAVAQLKAAAAR